MSAVFCGVGSGVWVWCGVMWCVALRGLGWTVLCGCAAAVVGRSEAERGGATSCLRWTAGVAAPVAQAAVAVAVSPPWAAAGLLPALLVWGVVWCVVAVWVCVRCGVCVVDVCVAGWVGVGVCVGVFVFVEGGGGGGGERERGEGDVGRGGAGRRLWRLWRQSGRG